MGGWDLNYGYPKKCSYVIANNISYYSYYWKVGKIKKILPQLKLSKSFVSRKFVLPFLNYLMILNNQG